MSQNGLDMTPLSHHEILAVAAPFARSGIQVDLSASDRSDRRLAFRARLRPAADGQPAMTEMLTLAPAAERDGAPWRLQRTLTRPDGAEALLEADGPDAAELLTRVQAVPPARQFRGDATALHHRVADDGMLTLRRARAQVAGLTLVMQVSGVSGFPAELELLRNEGDTIALPRDLLAVMGRRWDRLSPVRRGWTASVGLRGSGSDRSNDAEARFAQAVAHLAHTLSEPPGNFHDRHRGARWRVAMRGTLPLAVGAGIVALAFVLRAQGDGPAASALALLANITPPLLMGLFFLRREMPQIGLPRIPRRPTGERWR
jgi:hypothetical protein